MKNYLYILIIFTIIVTTISCKPANDAISVDNIIYPSFKKEDFGKIELMIEYGDHSVIGAHFPTFGIESIDSITKDLILSEIGKFKLLVKDLSTTNKNYKSELNIDYETYQFSDNIVSIKFLILEDLSYYAHPNTMVVTKTYDLAAGESIALEDIMEGDYLDEISEFIINFFTNSKDYQNFVNLDSFKEALTANLNGHPNFILEKDKITFVFQKYELFSGSFGNPTVGIPYDELDQYFNSYFINEIPIAIVSSENNTDIIKLEKASSTIPSPTRDLDPTKPMVALTFDDGPNKNTTIPILDTLKEYDSVATFFVLGNRVPDNEDILKRMQAEGSEIGNHSFNHKQLTTITSSELGDQINKTQDAVMEVVGSKPKLMRPTYGSYNDNLKSRIEMPMILWSVDTLDWKSKDAEKISNHVLTTVKDGDIVLMHDIYGSTADAVKTIVPELIHRGYQLVTVSELYELRNEALEVGNIYRSSYIK